MESKTKKLVSIITAIAVAISVIAVVSVSAADSGLKKTDAAIASLTSVGIDETTPADPEASSANIDESIGKVKNVVKTSFETDSITLTWDKVDDAAGYYVYCCDVDSGEGYKKVADVKKNTATIKKLNHTTQYYFKVSAYVEGGFGVSEGVGTIKKTATQPGKVEGLSMVRSSNVIEFKWNANRKATGYKIYRACSATGGSYVLYKTLRNGETTSFTDTNIELGRAYYYSVRPFRELYGGQYNAPHNTIKFICGLGAPSQTMTTQLSRVSLTWGNNKYAHGYDILYSTSKSSGYKKLGTTTKNFFNTVRLKNGQTYYFRVQPYKINGASKTKVLGTYTTKSITVTDKAYGKTIGNTYVEISIKAQYMWLYKGGKLIVETPVVTGNDDGYSNTTKGAYTINSRAQGTTLYGPGYASYVNYWMGFNGGIGIHDASWRSTFGGTIYQGNGSHGCVNTPYNAVKKIYNNTSYGTPVVVY